MVSAKAHVKPSKTAQRPTHKRSPREIEPHHAHRRHLRHAPATKRVTMYAAGARTHEHTHTHHARAKREGSHTQRWDRNSELCAQESSDLHNATFPQSPAWTPHHHSLTVTTKRSAHVGSIFSVTFVFSKSCTALSTTTKAQPDEATHHIAAISKGVRAGLERKCNFLHTRILRPPPPRPQRPPHLD